MLGMSAFAKLRRPFPFSNSSSSYTPPSHLISTYFACLRSKFIKIFFSFTIYFLKKKDIILSTAPSPKAGHLNSAWMKPCVVISVDWEDQSEQNIWRSRTRWSKMTREDSPKFLIFQNCFNFSDFFGENHTFQSF